MHRAVAFRTRALDMLGGRDPLEVLATTAAVIDDLARGQPEERLRRRPAPDRWCALEVVGHLGDAELVFGYRLRMILWQDEPAIVGFDERRWVDEQGYAGRAAPELLERFTALRRLNLPMWTDLDAAQLARCGIHAVRGREPLGDLRRICAGHDLIHVAQLRGALAGA